MLSQYVGLMTSERRQGCPSRAPPFVRLYFFSRFKQGRLVMLVPHPPASQAKTTLPHEERERRGRRVAASRGKKRMATLSLFIFFYGRIRGREVSRVVTNGDGALACSSDETICCGRGWRRRGRRGSSLLCSSKARKGTSCWHVCRPVVLLSSVPASPRRRVSLP